MRSDLQGRRRDGSTVELEIGLSTIDTADGPAALAVVLDVGERRAQQQRLEAALEARETLLREFYHRIKNNLQMVHSLLRMQQRALPAGVARAALEDTARRVQAMALVHEQLRHAVQPAEVALDGYTAQLLTLAAESAGAGARGIRVEADVDALPVPFELAVPYGLLVNELVANALQHAFGSDGGIVTVCLREEGGAPRLRVCDDGRGLPPGFALTTLTTMGLQLASALAAQLGGTLEIEAPPGARGACFACTLQRLAVTAHAADSPSVAEAE